MRRTPVQSLDFQLSNLPLIEKLNLIEQVRELCFEHEFDAISESASLPEQQAIPMCPEEGCGSVEVSRYGRRDGRQRYKCGECGRIFIEPKRKILVSSSRLSKSVWMRFIGCFIDDLTCKASAERCGVSENTAHYMRLRLMSVIEATSKKWKLNTGRTAQVDETFLLESFKGNRTLCADFSMPREPYIRGRVGDTTRNRVPGKGKADYICVLAGVDDERRCFFEAIGRGTPTSDELLGSLAARLSPGSVLVTDDLNAYPSMLRDLKVKHSKHPSTDHGPLNHVNALHNHIKSLMRGRRAISTRRLPLYLAAFAWRWQVAFNRTRDELSRRLAQSMASFDVQGIARSLKDAAYPCIEWWHGTAGRKEIVRQELLRVQHGIDKARREAVGDESLMAIVEERQRHLNERAKEEGVRLRTFKIAEEKAGAHGSRTNLTLFKLKSGTAPA